jgi:uncharacterized protein (DUF1778 family)
MSETVRLNIKIDDQLRSAAKVVAAQSGVTMTGLAQAALLAAVENPDRARELLEDARRCDARGNLIPSKSARTRLGMPAGS